MPELKINGGVTTVKKITTQTGDMDKKEGLLVISCQGGEQIKIKGRKEITDGFSSKMPVEVIIRRSQKTLEESLPPKKKKEDKKENKHKKSATPMPRQ